MVRSNSSINTNPFTDPEVVRNKFYNDKLKQSGNVTLAMICKLLSRVSRGLRSMQESRLPDKSSQRTTLHFELNQVKKQNRSVKSIGK